MDGGYRMVDYGDNDDIGLRKYQEKVEKEIPKDEIRIYNKLIEDYINQGVNSEDAKILAHFSVLAEVFLERIEEDEDPWLDADDMLRMYFFKVNKDGYITELHLHHSESVFLTILPRMLASLKYLEVIMFPDNLIKEIPEWIVNLKSLRILDVSNIHYNPNPNRFIPDSVKPFIDVIRARSLYQNPYVPDSIKPFIESLESFNGLSGDDIAKYFLMPKDIIKPTYTHYNIHYDILIVEDDLPTIRLLINYFESKGITCKALVSGTKALEQLEYCTPKLILTDITHPGPSGYDISKEIKSNQKWKKIPVFFCTYTPGFEVEKHLAETKADGYIQKPFNFSDFDKILDLLKT